MVTGAKVIGEAVSITTGMGAGAGAGSGADAGSGAGSDCTGTTHLTFEKHEYPFGHGLYRLHVDKVAQVDIT